MCRLSRKQLWFYYILFFFIRVLCEVCVLVLNVSWLIPFVSKMFDIFFHFSYSDCLRRVLWVKRCFCRGKRFGRCNSCWQWFPAKWNRECSTVLQDSNAVNAVLSCFLKCFKGWQLHRYLMHHFELIYCFEGLSSLLL